MLGRIGISPFDVWLIIGGRLPIREPPWLLRMPLLLMLLFRFMLLVLKLGRVFWCMLLLLDGLLVPRID